MTRFLLLTLTFLSAFLLFIIQPLYAKYLLPYFGGTASVWTISIFFYSTVLLVGYLYAALLMSWSRRIGWLVHTLLMGAAIGLLTVRGNDTASALLTPAINYSEPALSVLLTLLSSLGLLVVLLASTSIITQRLYATLTSREPYALFSLSNAGSLGGLTLYPFFIEPFTRLTSQAIAWVGGFVLYALLLSFVWWWINHQSVSKIVVREQKEQQGRLAYRGRILFLAAIPTFLLAATTEILSQGIASFRVWGVVPLVLYLLTFILAFGGVIERVAPVVLGVLGVFFLTLAVHALPNINQNAFYYWFGFIALLASFFVVSLYMHQAVYRLRPVVRDLGPFYVWVTLGGALGSGTVGLLMPLLLNRQIELLIIMNLLLLFFVLRYLKSLQKLVAPGYVRLVQGMAILLVVLSFWNLTTKEGVVAEDRNFYGTLTVRDASVEYSGQSLVVRSITNGSTVHGLEVIEGEYNKRAASYYGPDSGIDVAIQSVRETGVKPRVAVIGLGIGMMNAYCDDAAALSYYEINPAVWEFAKEYFTYLDHCTEKTTIALGDGRLLLEEEVAQGGEPYHVIMVDAFTDDSIPAHLLTTEAFTEAYQPLLQAGGVIAFHISNRFLDLAPPIVGMARRNGYAALIQIGEGDSEDPLVHPTNWVLVTESAQAERLLTFPGVSLYRGAEFVWSDEKSSVLNVLSMRGSQMLGEDVSVVIEK